MIRAVRFVALAIILSSSPAAAYELMGISWRSSDFPVPWRLTQVGSRSVHDGSDLAAVIEGYVRWENVTCATVRMQEATPLPSNREGIEPSQRDGLNDVLWLNNAWAHGRQTLGVTIPVYDFRGNIQQADIIFNDRDYTWTTGTQGGWRTDVLSIALHEIGHFFGLDHSAQTTAVMYASYGGRPLQTLQPDDIDGICALYPAPAGPLARAGEPCSRRADCENHLLCVTEDGGITAFCRETCNPQVADSCERGFRCAALQSSTSGACLPNDEPPAALSCEACDSELPCSDGLLCDDGVCREPCTDDEDCGSGRCRQSGEPAGLCSCEGDPTDGESCETSLDCGEGELCIRDGTSADPVCRPRCDVDEDCADDRLCRTIGRSRVCAPDVDGSGGDLVPRAHTCGDCTSVGGGGLALLGLFGLRRRRPTLSR